MFCGKVHAFLEIIGLNDGIYSSQVCYFQSMLINKLKNASQKFTIAFVEVYLARRN